MDVLKLVLGALLVLLALKQWRGRPRDGEVAYALIGTIGVAAPVVIYFAMGDRAAPILARRGWGTTAP